MSRSLCINIPEKHWHDISKAPKDGRIVFVSDDWGHVDLAKWSNEEWTAEIGVCDVISKFSYVSIG